MDLGPPPWARAALPPWFEVPPPSSWQIGHFTRLDRYCVIYLWVQLNRRTMPFSDGMSLAVLGHAEEFKGKVAFNALWPETAIATAAVEMIAGKTVAMAASRKETIMADAAHRILTQDHRLHSGNFFIDSEVLSRVWELTLSMWTMIGTKVNLECWPLVSWVSTTSMLTHAFHVRYRS